MSEVIAVAFVMMALDILSGFIGAVKNGDVQSGKMRDGLFHKAGFAGVIVLAAVLEYVAAYVNLGVDIPAIAAVCVWIIVTEAASIGENLCILNPEISRSPFGKIFNGHGAE